MLFVELETAECLAAGNSPLFVSSTYLQTDGQCFPFSAGHRFDHSFLSFSLTLPIAQTLFQQFDIQLHIRVHFDEKRLLTLFIAGVSIYIVVVDG